MSAPRILVWDWPTRAFHWLLVASFAGAFVTAESERWRDVHVVLGYSAAGLIAFRLLWGLVGTRYARFANFVAGPGRVLTYLKGITMGRPQHFTGHNPAGGWAIVALLGGLAITVASGWATYTERGGHFVEELHETIGNGLLLLVGIHVAGVVVGSFLHRENLVASMISGFKQGDPAEAIRRSHAVIAIALVAALAAFWVFGRRYVL